MEVKTAMKPAPAILYWLQVLSTWSEGRLLTDPGPHSMTNPGPISQFGITSETGA
jgi:hypothetical protein